MIDIKKLDTNKLTRYGAAFAFKMLCYIIIMQGYVQ